MSQPEKDSLSATPRPATLTERLRAYIPVEGQEGLCVRDSLMREAADEIERLKAQLKDMEKEIRETAKEAYAEGQWQVREELDGRF